MKSSQPYASTTWLPLAQESYLHSKAEQREKSSTRELSSCICSPYEEGKPFPEISEQLSAYILLSVAVSYAHPLLQGRLGE